MINSGIAGMPLHFGRVPKWLTNRMGDMGITIIESIVQNYGKSEVLTRISDPNWFQAFGSVMGMQWNSSGITACVLGSLKYRVNPRANDLGIYILGGKGKYGYNAPREIKNVSCKHNLNQSNLVKSFKLTNKIDNNAIMDGYSLYQKYFILSDEGEWVAITQGMNSKNRRARRYHWHSPEVKSFVDNPHKGIAGIDNKKIINLVDSNAHKTRNNLVSLIKESPVKIMDECKKISFDKHHDINKDDVNMQRLGNVLDLAYNKRIDNFQDLLLLKGLGPKTLKSLALVSEVIHGDSSRFDDPARFAFAVGGKDGVPHPVDTKTYDDTISFMQDAVEKSKLGYSDKSKAIKRLHRAVKKTESNFIPNAFLDTFLNMEWADAEKNSGMTFMGKTVKGLTRKITGLYNFYSNLTK